MTDTDRQQDRREAELAWARRIAEQKRLMPDLDHSQPTGKITPPGQEPDHSGSAVRPWGGASSQAGLAALRGPQHSYPSVPAPGEPGSRFNPVVRQRPGRDVAQEMGPSPASAMITTLGQALDSQTTRSDPPAPTTAPVLQLSERFDYQFEVDEQASDALEGPER